MPAYRHNAFAATPLTKTAKTAETALTESGNTGKYVQLKSLREPRKQRIPMMQASTVQTSRFDYKMKMPKAQGGVDGTYIYGSLDWSDNWDDDYTPYGIYRLPINGSDAVRFVRINDKLRSNGGGVYKDGKYYFINCYSGLWGSKFPYFSVADTENGWQLIVDEKSVPASSVATDMTYDPVSDKVYGCFADADEQWKQNFGTFDLETGESTPIAPAVETYAAMAADNDGHVFAIGASGKLYEMNKETGEATLIGDTGVSTDYVSSACVDPATNKIYWNVSVPSGMSGYDVFTYLYEVNTADATLRTVCQPALNEQFTGMFIFPPKAEAGAPDVATGLKVTVEGEALSGTLSFTMPAVSYTGEALSGQLDYAVTLSGEALTSGKAEAGSAVEVPFTIAHSSLCVFEVTASNEAGNGPVAKIEQWVGPDVPRAVENLTARWDKSKGGFNIAWDASLKGEHNNTLDAARVSYRVVRYPGEVTVADGISETTAFDAVSLPENYTVYHYEVTAAFEGNSGATAVSNAASLGSIIPPYAEPFDSKFGLDVYTVLNPGGDSTWAFAEREDGVTCASVRFDAVNPMDDWMITPPVRLEADRYYHFSFKASSASTVWVEKVEAAWGNEPTAAGMANIIVEPTLLENTEFTTLSGKMLVEQAGDYYFGIHGISDRYQHTLYVDDVEITPGASLKAPAAPVVSATADASGALTVNVSVTAPDKDLKGENVGQLTKLELYRNGELVKTFDNPAAGAVLTFTDDTAAEGVNTYTAKAENSFGEGETGSTDVFAGFDVPAAPRNVKVTDTPTGQIAITWEAPLTGANGGAINASSLKYSIVREHDESVIANRISDLTFTDTPFGNGVQGVERYFIVAETIEGIGTGVFSDAIPAGTPYALPFAESFAETSLSYDTWLVRRPAESNAVWGISAVSSTPVASPADNDNGMGVFTPTAAGESATMLSGKISVKGATNPVVEFSYYYTPCNDAVAVEVLPEGGESTTVQTIDYYAINDIEGWRRATVSLKDYVTSAFIRIGFTATAGAADRCIYIDNIVVRDLLDYDLGVTGVSVAARPAIGVPSPVTVTVTNFGDKAAEGYSVALYRNGELQERFAGFKLDPKSSREYTHTCIASSCDPAESEWEARIEFTADMNEANNSRKAMSFAANTMLPTVSDLAAVALENGNVNLTWSAPSATIARPTTDSAEDYEAYAITGIGEWTMADGDGAYTYGFSNANNEIIEYPNAGMPMAFQVLEPSLIGLGEGDLASVAPHSGKKIFVAFSAVDVPNDDWMISPLLSGKSQVISFFAKSLTDTYGLESFELYYSTSGTELTDFVKVESVDGSAVPTSWTEYAAKLPEGTKHFAIRCVSVDKFALMIDDLTFTEAGAESMQLTLKGYNIYLDKTVQNNSPVSDTAIEHNPGDSNLHHYQVTAVYAEGESAGSNIVSVGQSGLDSVTVGNAVSVKAEGNVIVVSADTAIDVAIYATDGKLMFASAGNKHYKVAAQTGVYLVKAGDETVKLAVK